MEMQQFEIPIDRAAEPALTAVVADEAPCFEKIVEAHYAALFRFAMSMCRDQATAQDLVQHTFLQWARKGETLRDKSRVKTWLFTTLYREWLGMARREQRYERVEFDPERHGAVQEADGGRAPRVDGATLQEALAGLSPDFRAPLVLFYLKELSYKEIADILEVPVGTVMSRLSRAKDALRKILRHSEGAIQQGGPA